MGEAIVGALIGAFVGSVLGYLFSYRLADQTRRLDLEDRRKRLMRALSHEIAREFEETGEGSDEQITIWSGVHLATLSPLIELVADLPDEALLLAMTRLHAEVNSFNDMAQSINHIQVHIATNETVHGSYTTISRLGCSISNRGTHRRERRLRSSRRPSRFEPRPARPRVRLGSLEGSTATGGPCRLRRSRRWGQPADPSPSAGRRPAVGPILSGAAPRTSSQDSREL